MKFELNINEEKMLREWEENHKCRARGKSSCGGETTISFTPTGIGLAVEATCICGEKIDIREL